MHQGSVLSPLLFTTDVTVTSSDYTVGLQLKLFSMLTVCYDDSSLHMLQSLSNNH